MSGPMQREQTYQTVEQFEAEGAFVAARAAMAGLRTSEGHEVDGPAAEGLCRLGLHVADALCADGDPVSLNQAEGYGAPVTAAIYRGAPRRGRHLVVLARSLAQLEPLVRRLAEGEDWNWHDASDPDCCPDGACPTMDDHLHPEVMLRSVRNMRAIVHRAMVVRQAVKP